MGNAIAPHIERAEKTGTCNLTKQGLTEFPDALLKLTRNLRTLDVSENKLAVIPSWIGNFSVLKSLNFNNNRIGTLTAEIGKLKKLESLNVSNNRLTAIPPAFSNLNSLRDVNLAYNRLTVFPLEFVGLKNLDSLDVSHNRITAVPEAVRGLELIELNLNQNQVSRLADSIAECPRLKVLRLEENCLELTAFTPRILKHSNISLLTVEGNMFEMKSFHQADGYEQYMERYTATKKKFN